ncbi:MAG: lytic murein transglycosylase [Candidatus Giovannonibacteria bacterium]|nr:MAG: lytic murein transglycosylase [Candidatus Giovannonibacteria bacterium]
MSNLINLISVFLLAASLANAQVDPVRGIASNGIDPALVNSRRAELETQLREYETQIDQYQGLIQAKQAEADSLKREIDILNAEISKAKLEIKARTLNIQKLIGDINQKSKNIEELVAEINASRQSLTEFLRKVRQNDNFSALELALIYDNVSEFFGELQSINNLQASLQQAFAKFSSLKIEEEKVRDELEEQKREELELRALQELQKKALEKNEKEKQKLLKDTKGKESEYQKVLKDKQKNAASIRSQLFLLVGSPSIPFEKALEYADLAEKATGVRPAFLLGLITEESNLGQNVGKGNWRIDLSHARCAKQREAFLQITSELGLDPDLMPVSKKAWYGYCGGAMGPAQFIPTTWQLYKNAVARRTGNNPPSPWEPKDAFMAAALLLKDNGAKAGNYNAEWTAAMKYLAGSNWNKKAYRFYGDDVMAIAKKYQEQIDLLQELAQR